MMQIDNFAEFKEKVLENVISILEKENDGTNAQDISEEVKTLRDSCKEGNKTIHIGSLVELENEGRKQYIFITPTLTGQFVMIDMVPVMIVSVFSPMGNEMLDQNAKCTISVKGKHTQKDYYINEVY